MPLLGFDPLGGTLHVLMVVVAVIVFAFGRRGRRWVTWSMPVGLWLVLAAIDLLVSKGGSFRPLYFVVYAAALAIPLAVSLAAVAAFRRTSLARRWQAIAGIAVGILAMLPWPAFLLMFGCAFTGECL